MSNEDLEIVVEVEEELDEMSAAGGAGAAVVGHADPRKRKRATLFREEDIQYTDRNAFIEELMLREIIHEAIRSIHNNKIQEQVREDDIVRKLIQKVLKEEAADVDDAPHRSTGINVLEELLKKIIPILEDSYKTMTTKKEQRDSFKAHILNAIKSTLTTADIVKSAGANDLDAITEEPVPLDDEIVVNVGPDEDVSGPENDDKFIDVTDKAPDEKDTFGLPGQDETGRNLAEMTYDKIEQNILDSFAILSDNEDKKLFSDYLMTNISLYFDKFETEVDINPREPQVGTPPDAEINQDNIDGNDDLDLDNDLEL